MIIVEKIIPQRIPSYNTLLASCIAEAKVAIDELKITSDIYNNLSKVNVIDNMFTIVDKIWQPSIYLKFHNVMINLCKKLDFTILKSYINVIIIKRSNSAKLNEAEINAIKTTIMKALINFFGSNMSQLVEVNCTECDLLLSYPKHSYQIRMNDLHEIYYFKYHKQSSQPLRKLIEYLRDKFNFFLAYGLHTIDKKREDFAIEVLSNFSQVHDNAYNYYHTTASLRYKVKLKQLDIVIQFDVCLFDRKKLYNNNSLHVIRLSVFSILNCNAHVSAQELSDIEKLEQYKGSFALFLRKIAYILLKN